MCECPPGYSKSDDEKQCLGMYGVQGYNLTPCFNSPHDFYFLKSTSPAPNFTSPGSEL